MATVRRFGIPHARRGVRPVPDVLPILGRGRHPDPRTGGCLMEYVSLLAGEPWSDHPGCTQPLLAAIARCVNDAVDEAHRQQLLPLAADLAGARNARPLITAGLVAHCVGAALRYQPADPDLGPVLAIAQQRVRWARQGPRYLPALGRCWMRVTERDFLHTVAVAAATRSVGIVVRHGGQGAVTTLLESSLSEYRLLSSLDRPAHDGRRRVPRSPSRLDTSAQWVRSLDDRPTWP